MRQETVQQIADGTVGAASKLAYVASSAGMAVAALTITEVVGIAVGVFSIITMVLTAWVNYSNKRRANQLLDLQIEDQLRNRQVDEGRG
ncbi:hypothetical protein [Methylophaga lonarensis]|uniref:hypothetical protein n=1 Tax=Methylophaga lonarensis TaxID=999151 RepID=UPI003D295DF0